VQEQQLRENLTQLDGLRDEKEREVERLRQIEDQHQQTLRQYQQRQRVTQGRLDQLQKDEAALANVIAGLERRRRDEESRAGGPVTGMLTTRDLGALNWPVDGNLVFRFGPDRRPNGVVLRYNGIGIAAPVGTPVKAVETGTVQIAGTLEGYGLAVVISHGAGAYTLYFRLQQVSVRVGQGIVAGQMIGTVGGSGTEYGPHLEFQVRVPTNGTPTPVDPLDWLRSRPGR
jgi:murein DD-endopeptidase MepM/ murein hydrolase activator NlpD